MTPASRAARWLYVEDRALSPMMQQHVASLASEFAACEREALERAVKLVESKTTTNGTVWVPFHNLAIEIRSLAAGAAR